MEQLSKWSVMTKIQLQYSYLFVFSMGYAKPFIMARSIKPGCVLLVEPLINVDLLMDGDFQKKPKHPTIIAPQIVWDLTTGIHLLPVVLKVSKLRYSAKKMVGGLYQQIFHMHRTRKFERLCLHMNDHSVQYIIL